MPRRFFQIIGYMIIALITSVAYGLSAYILIYRDLAGGSILHAYLWNMVFIIVVLSIDKLIYLKMQSKEFTITRKNYLIARWTYFESLISFKTTVYLFYIFILVASQIATIDPTFASEDFRNFILSIEYGLLLVIAFDSLIGHLFKDIERVRVISEKFMKYRSEKPHQ